MAEPESKTTKKRKVKNPTSFREQALKSNQELSESKTSNRSFKLSSIFKPLTSLLTNFFKSNFFKPFRRPLTIVGKVLFPPYFRSSWQELKKVTWPNWNQSRRLTFAVLVFAVIFGAAIAGVDWVLDKLFRHILLK